MQPESALNFLHLTDIMLEPGVLAEHESPQTGPQNEGIDVDKLDQGLDVTELWPFMQPMGLYCVLGARKVGRMCMLMCFSGTRQFHERSSLFLARCVST